LVERCDRLKELYEPEPEPEPESESESESESEPRYKEFFGDYEDDDIDLDVHTRKMRAIQRMFAARCPKVRKAAEALFKELEEEAARDLKELQARIEQEKKDRAERIRLEAEARERIRREAEAREWEDSEEDSEEDRDPNLTILGLTEDDRYNKTAIKKAYRKLALRWHPDKGGDTETFKRIVHAYQALMI
jgi:hypothetical protein